jgi:hypothetical protein
MNRPVVMMLPASTMAVLITKLVITILPPDVMMDRAPTMDVQNQARAITIHWHLVITDRVITRDVPIQVHVTMTNPLHATVVSVSSVIVWTLRLVIMTPPQYVMMEVVCTQAVRIHKPATLIQQQFVATTCNACMNFVSVAPIQTPVTICHSPNLTMVLVFIQAV